MNGTGYRLKRWPRHSPCPHRKGGRRASTMQPTILAVFHQKGGVGHSTTVWQLGAELALRGKRVRIEDLDQGCGAAKPQSRLRRAFVNVVETVQDWARPDWA